jgi:hypothetical protein
MAAARSSAGLVNWRRTSASWNPPRGRDARRRCSGRCPRPGAGSRSSAVAPSANWRCRPAGRTGGTGGSSCRDSTACGLPGQARTRMRLPAPGRQGPVRRLGGAGSARGAARRQKVQRQDAAFTVLECLLDPVPLPDDVSRGDPDLLAREVEPVLAQRADLTPPSSGRDRGPQVQAEFLVLGPHEVE